MHIRVVVKQVSAMEVLLDSIFSSQYVYGLKNFKAAIPFSSLTVTGKFIPGSVSHSKNKNKQPKTKQNNNNNNNNKKI